VPKYRSIASAPAPTPARYTQNARLCGWKNRNGRPQPDCSMAVSWAALASDGVVIGPLPG
jgi:hypothetical protein